jgi:hypothetical protein
LTRKYQSRLVDCGLLPLLIAGAAVGERDAMRCAQCLNLMARMPGQSAALLEHGALPLRRRPARVVVAAHPVGGARRAGVGGVAGDGAPAGSRPARSCASAAHRARSAQRHRPRSGARRRCCAPRSLTLSAVLHSTGTDVAVAI